MSDLQLQVDEHPQLVPAAFVTELPRPLGELDASPMAELL